MFHGLNVSQAWPGINQASSLSVRDVAGRVNGGKHVSAKGKGDKGRGRRRRTTLNCRFS